jgi:hypothetical protein
MSLLIDQHPGGFFATCSIRLKNIICYFNANKRVPENLDSSALYEWYKIDGNNNDITFDYFDYYDMYDTIDYVKPIFYSIDDQFIDYSKLNYRDICPFVQKYFSLSAEIKENIVNLEDKYGINYDNTCILFYRGNDKQRETKLSGYTDYILYAKAIQSKSPTVIFMIQSDETEFIETMTAAFPNNSFYMKDEIRHMKSCNDTVDNTMRRDISKFSKFYLAITVVMSRCSYIVCGSGNCSFWIMFYRGNNNNVYQYLNGQWIIPHV